ncbi:MAG: hypothetical protein ACR2HR_16845 [Euzebya sp.]
MTKPTDIREQLAAYLVGELDEVATIELEDRIHAEPWVANLADDMADMLMELGTVDEVQPPAGFGERLRRGLSQELGNPLPEPSSLVSAGAAAATGWAKQDRPGAGRSTSSRPPGDRPSRGRSSGSSGSGSRRWLAVAAAFAVLAVATVTTLTSTGFLGSSEDTADFAGEADIALDARQADDTADESRDDLRIEAAQETPDSLLTDDGVAPASNAAADSAAGAVPASSEAEQSTTDDAATDQAASVLGTAGRPAVLTLGPVADGDDTLRELVGGQEAAQMLLGTPASSAAELAVAYRDEILRSQDYDDGTPAGTCLTEVLDDAGADLVPAVAARVDVEGGASLAFALVRSTDGQVLDTVEVWLVSVSDCGLQTVLSV